MIRFFISFSIGIFTFLLGSIIAINLYYRIEMLSVEVESPIEIVKESTPAPIELLTSSIVINPKTKQKFVCKSKEKYKVWNVLKNTEFVKGMLEHQDDAENCNECIAEIKHLELNNDGQDELLVVSGFRLHPSSFLITWILQKTQNGYRIVLDERNDEFTILKNRTNGFSDLFFVSRRTIQSEFLSHYRYRNGEYRTASCKVKFYASSGKKTKIFNCDDEKEIEKYENGASETISP